MCSTRIAEPFLAGESIIYHWLLVVEPAVSCVDAFRHRRHVSQCMKSSREYELIGGCFLKEAMNSSENSLPDCKN